jgi:NAD(P)-dependent dehydrogenase (short-subunit alcohol dehydrogenase family)
MKILLIGAGGTIGKKLAAALASKHEVITASRHAGNITVNITDAASISKMYEQCGAADAVINLAGEAKWNKLHLLTEEDFYVGIRSKLMGQVNLVRLGLNYLNPNGSFTLTTGILGDQPVDMTAAAAMVNGGINSFIRAVALELEGGRRINVVSSDLVEDSAEKYAPWFPGHNPVPMQKVVNAYIRSVEGKINGEVVRVFA